MLQYYEYTIDVIISLVWAEPAPGKIVKGKIGVDITRPTLGSFFLLFRVLFFASLRNFLSSWNSLTPAN